MNAKNSSDKKEIDFKYNFKTYWEFVKKYKFMMIILVVLITLSEGINILSKYLFKILVDKGAEFSSGSILLYEFSKVLLIIAAVYVITSLISVIFTWLRNHYLNKLELNVMRDIKIKFFNHILDLDHEFHTSHKTGSMISRILRGSGSAERMTDVIAFNFITIIVQLVIVTFSLIYIDMTSAVIIFLTVVVFILYSLYFLRLQEKSNILLNQQEDIEKANLADFLTNIDSIKYYGKEKNIKDRFLELTLETKKRHSVNWGYFRWLNSGQIFIISLGVFLLMFFSIKEFLAGEMTIGTLTFVYTIFYGLIGYMYGLVHGLRGFYRSMADFQDLFYYGKIEKKIVDKPDSKELKIKDGEIEFRNVNFNYGKRGIFKDFNLKIPKNKKIALVGHSGCGKTTLVKLLYRFYDVNSGEILIDGVDIKDFKEESLRNEMSIVPQECILFDDTIYNNIKFSNPSASRQEVINAIKFAQLDKIINQFPNKENTIVGERGVKLSGGEKQRVSIARAILANKKILVLDEATSSLDSELEHEIQKDLKNLMKGRTSLIIAHRLSTIMEADKIIVMKKGKIIQSGTHKELIGKIGEYKKLWSLQKGGYIK